MYSLAEVAKIKERELEEVLDEIMDDWVENEDAESAKISIGEMIDEVRTRGICVPYTINNLKEDLKALKD